MGTQAAELLKLTRLRGVTITAVGGLLRVAGPPGQVERFKPAIRAIKPQLLQHLAEEAEAAEREANRFITDDELDRALPANEYFRETGYGSMTRYREWQAKARVGVPLEVELADQRKRKSASTPSKTDKRTASAAGAELGF